MWARMFFRAGGAPDAPAMIGPQLFFAAHGQREAEP